MPVPHHSVFTGRMPFLPPNQQRQSTQDMPIIILPNMKQFTVEHSHSTKWWGNRFK